MCLRFAYCGPNFVPIQAGHFTAQTEIYVGYRPATVSARGVSCPEADKGNRGLPGALLPARAWLRYFEIVQNGSGVALKRLKAQPDGEIDQVRRTGPSLPTRRQLRGRKSADMVKHPGPM